MRAESPLPLMMKVLFEYQIRKKKRKVHKENVGNEGVNSSKYYHQLLKLRTYLLLRFQNWILMELRQSLNFPN